MYPSGADRAVSAAPMLPPAPGLFSTVTGWPMDFASSRPIARAVMSTPPPGGKGQIMRIGFEGNAWASAPWEAINPNTAASAAIK